MTNYDHEYMITDLSWSLVARIIKQFIKKHQNYKNKTDLEILQTCSMNYMISKILKIREKETAVV
jgi:hypothetical protein